MGTARFELARLSATELKSVSLTTRTSTLIYRKVFKLIFNIFGVAVFEK
jgi:hypothetical protein